MSTKTVSPFVFLISHLFQQPFLCRFKDVPFQIIWWNIAQDICKILQGSNFQCEQFMLFDESSAWTIISAHEHLWALRSSLEYGAVVTWVLLRTQECSWRHGPILMNAHEHSWAFFNTHKCSRILMSTHESSWVFMNAHERSLVPMRAHSTTHSAYGCSRAVFSTH